MRNSPRNDDIETASWGIFHVETRCGKLICERCLRTSFTALDNHRINRRSGIIGIYWLLGVGASGRSKSSKR